MEIESGTNYRNGEIESAQRKCKCKWHNYEARLTHEERGEPTGVKIIAIPRVTLEKSD